VFSIVCGHTGPRVFCVEAARTPLPAQTPEKLKTELKLTPENEFMNMRPGPNNKRSRGRGRGKHHGGGGGGGSGPRTGGGGGGGGQDQVFNIHRTIDSNGPDVKIRGNAHHIYEKYLQLARDANSSGDRVMAENYLQHAEHYYRLIMAYQATVQQQQPQAGQQVGGQPYGNGGGQSQPQQQPQAGNYNGGGQRHQPNGTGPQPGTDANGNRSENGNGDGSQSEVSYRDEDGGRYD
jgi:Domain of unknown function (DUF4167)